MCGVASSSGYIDSAKVSFVSEPGVQPYAEINRSAIWEAGGERKGMIHGSASCHINNLLVE